MRSSRHLQSVVNSAVLRHQLRGRLLLAYAHVGRREGVGGGTETAGPALVPEVGLAVGVENSLALPTEDWVVVERREVRSLLERCEETPQRDHSLSCLRAGVGPMVPGEPDAVSPLVSLDKLF